MRVVFSIAMIVGFFFGHQSTAQNGVFEDTVYCKDRSQFYSIYFPTGYSETSPTPLLMFFDPSGVASYPVKQYSTIADKYGFILASPYGARNGRADIASTAFYAVLDEINSRHKIDETSIVVSGFSGGARGVSQYSINDRQIAGVIACGATFPPNVVFDNTRKIPYAVVIGDVDMNYLEAVSVQEELRERKNPAVVVAYSGGHTWPPIASVDEALSWVLARNNKLQKDAAIEIYNKQFNRVKMLLDSGEIHGAGMLAEQMNLDYHDSKTDSLWKTVSKHKDFIGERKKFIKLADAERRWRAKFDEQYQNAMANGLRDSAFRSGEWKEYAIEFKKLRRSKDLMERQSGERLHDFSWRRCSEPGFHYFQDQRYKEALVAMQIWTALDDKDFRPLVRMARVYVQLDKKKLAVQQLKKAVDLGFENKEAMMRDSVLSSLKEERAFQKLLADMK